MKIYFSDLAQKEFQDAIYYYDEIMSQLCNELILEIEDAKQLILSFPMAWSKIGKNQRKFVLKKFPYMIIYKIYCDRILIAAFAHQHRKPYYYIK